MSDTSILLSKFSQKEAKICIVGLGYVGLPLLLRFFEEGFSVLGLDIDKLKIEKINAGETYIQSIPEHNIKKLSLSAKSEITNDFSKINDCDAIVICVPTPLSKNFEPNLDYVKATMSSIMPYLKQGQIISLESTTYPGTTEEEIREPLENQGFDVGKNFFVVYSPEREDPGNQKYDTKSIPKICGGVTDNCLKIGSSMYRAVIDEVIEVSSTKVAELSKLLENIYRSINIGLVNEMKVIADKMGIDIYEVIDAAATKPFGFKAFYPGPGLGGHCIPIDPYYLTWKAKEFGINSKFIELSGEVNRSMPDYVVSKANDALNLKKKSINSSKILVLGISYKKNVDDCRESPSVEVIRLLQKKGAELDYSDPYFSEFPKLRSFKCDLKSVALTEENIKKYDLVILCTDHDLYDYGLIKNNADLIVDTRGVFELDQDNILRA